MPYTIHRSKVTFHSVLDWWLNPETSEAEAKHLPWLKTKKAEDVGTLCERCRCIEFAFFFQDPSSQRIFVEGKRWLADTPRKLGTLAHLRQGRISGCTFCTLVHEEICQLLDRNDANERAPVPGISRAFTTTTTNTADPDVWYQLYPQQFSAILAKPYKSSGLVASSPKSNMLRVRSKVSLSINLDPNKPVAWESTDRQYFNIALLHTPSNPVGLPGSVRIVGSESDTMDFDMVRDWLSKCRGCHPGHSASSCPITLREPVSRCHVTSFVDVKDLCLVEREVGEVTYAALSYVWGPTPFFRNTSSNRDNLRKHEGIGRYMDRVPRTIREAIILCQKIDIRFLWVDALCVTQDTYQLTEQVKNMNSVFSKASVTIVAAAGPNADSGLPGVVSNSRSKYQATAKTEDGFVITKALSPENIANRSEWNTRGWTFQERLLSRRMVVFSQDQVRMYCRHGAHTESFISDIHDHADTLSCVNSRELSHAFQDCRGMDFERYHNVVRAYTERFLTYESDVLNAFSGLMPALANKFASGEFCFGLPVCVLDLALLWRPQGRLQRRKAGDAFFPSWTWAGWKGPIEYATSQLLWEKTRPCIRWLCTQEKISADDTADGRWNPRAVIFPDEPEIPNEWERHPNASGMGPYYTCKADDVPRQHCRPTNRRPSFCTIKIRSLNLEAPIAKFGLGSQLHVVAQNTFSRRPSWDLDMAVSTLKVLDTRRRHVGFVTVDGETLKCLSHKKKYAFIGISRTVEEGGERDAAWEPTSRDYAWKPGEMAVNPDFKPRCEQGWSHVYDHNKYPCNLCWGLYNVLMIDDRNERLGVGQVHSQAFDAESKRRGQLFLN